MLTAWPCIWDISSCKKTAPYLLGLAHPHNNSISSFMAKPHVCLATCSWSLAQHWVCEHWILHNLYMHLYLLIGQASGLVVKMLVRMAASHISISGFKSQLHTDPSFLFRWISAGHPCGRRRWLSSQSWALARPARAAVIFGHEPADASSLSHKYVK